MRGFSFFRVPSSFVARRVLPPTQQRWSARICVGVHDNCSWNTRVVGSMLSARAADFLWHEHDAASLRRRLRRRRLRLSDRAGTLPVRRYGVGYLYSLHSVADDATHGWVQPSRHSSVVTSFCLLRSLFTTLPYMSLMLSGSSGYYNGCWVISFFLCWETGILHPWIFHSPRFSTRACCRGTARRHHSMR